MQLVTSSLAIRFYTRHGWNEENIIPFVTKAYPAAAFHFHDDGDMAYYVPNVGTRLDIKKLLEVVTKVERTFNDYPWESDEQHLEHFNW